MLQAAIPCSFCSGTTEHKIDKQIPVDQYNYGLVSCIVYYVPGSGACHIIHYSAIILVVSYHVIFQLVHVQWLTIAWNKNLQLLSDIIPRGYSQKGGVGAYICGPLPQTLTPFMTKFCDFCHPTYDLAKNLIPYFVYL